METTARVVSLDFIPAGHRKMRLQKQAVSALVFSLLLSPAVVMADGPAPAPIKAPSQDSVKLKNVELTEAGAFQGQYLTHTGTPVDAAEVVVTTGKTTLKTLTDEKGRFSIKGLQGGRCVIRIGKDTFACQLWANGTAPPNSLATVAVVKSDGDVVRGNMLGYTLNPMNHIHALHPRNLFALGPKQLIGLGIIGGGAAAIAIAASDDNDDAS